MGVSTCLRAKRLDTKGHEGKAKDHEGGSEQKEKTRPSRRGILDHGNLALLPMQIDFRNGFAISDRFLFLILLRVDFVFPSCTPQGGIVKKPFVLKELKEFGS